MRAMQKQLRNFVRRDRNFSCRPCANGRSNREDVDGTENLFYYAIH